MATFYLLIALVLLISIIFGLVRVARGPSAADRMLAVQLFGTTGVAVVLLLAKAFEQPRLNDVALVFAVLAAIVLIGFVRIYWRAEAEAEAEAGTEGENHG
jgi:multicomponent Na+:H+ antiporter subunit F